MSADTKCKSEKVLVVYYSLSGNTARVARDIARLTQGDIESLADREHGAGFLGYFKAALAALRSKPARLSDLKHDPRNYSLVIIGTPVWAGHITPAIRAYLQRFAADIPHVRFFVTSGSTEVLKIALSMEQILGHKADALVGFNARELGDRHIYDTRLAALLDSVDSMDPIRVHEPLPAFYL